MWWTAVLLQIYLGMRQYRFSSNTHTHISTGQYHGDTKYDIQLDSKVTDVATCSSISYVSVISISTKNHRRLASIGESRGIV